MAATRQPPPLQIFQDTDVFDEHHDVTDSEAHYLSTLGPITDITSADHSVFNPPVDSTSAVSPHKTDQTSSSPPPSALSDANFNSLRIPPPGQDNFTDSPLKRMGPPKRPGPPPSAYASMFQFPAMGSFDKENAAPAAKFVESSYQEPENIYHVKAGTKRSHGSMDSAPLKDKTNKKQKDIEGEAISTMIPEPEDMPSVVDDGKKPPYSYAQLIAMALLRAANRKLTLAQIYKWISDTFQYYSLGDTGWQNSIRHNLSLNKNFVKKDRPKDDPGKGNYWMIKEGAEHVFLKDKQPRRHPGSVGTPMMDYCSLPSFPQPPAGPSSSQAKSIDSSKFPEEAELSSDGTIPNSDPAIHDAADPIEESKLAQMPPPPPPHMRSSPPPPEIHSSPPAPVSKQAEREDTPPAMPPPRQPTHSRSGGRKRRMAGLGDSGYYSSIESSATKAHPVGPLLLTSDPDHERSSMRQGRAELEIARIRSSSYDSPSKPAQHKKNKSTGHLAANSPLRSRRTPLTPPVLFKRPMKAPPSVSPNTNLKNHRRTIQDLIGTPDRQYEQLSVFEGFTPGFDKNFPTIPDENQFSLFENGYDFKDNFDVFEGTSFVPSLGSPIKSSPAKRSVRRPRLERAVTSTNALADITGSAKSNRSHLGVFDNFLKIPSQTPLAPLRLGSPIKAGGSPLKSVSKPPTSHPVRADTHDFRDFGDENAPFQDFDDENDPNDFSIFADLHSDDTEEGVDILQGFSKIGGTSVAPNGSPIKQSRPSMSRSMTSTF